MNRWLMTTLVAGALVCPAVVLAQAPQPPPAPPQPANNAEAAEAEQAAQRAAEQTEMHEKAAAEVQIQVEQLRDLAEQQRVRAEELARWRVQGMDGMARVQLGGRVVTEKASWLGVSTSKVPEALRQHLELKHRYIGLVVERIEPDSPAAQAGLERFDIIERVNDQWIVNTEQFSVVLRMHEPGTEVNLAIIRKGKPQDMKVTLTEKELPVLGANEVNFFEAPRGIVAAAGNVVAPAAPQIFEWAPEGRLVVRHGAIEPLVLQRLRDERNAQILMRDPQHSLKITTRNGQRMLEASDANGVVIFEGPIDTEEERAAIPEEIREKVERLETGPNALKPPTQPADAQD